MLCVLDIECERGIIIMDFWIGNWDGYGYGKRLDKVDFWNVVIILFYYWWGY